MKVSSDAFTFNEILEEAQSLQSQFLAQKEPHDLGPEPDGVRRFQEAMKARLEGAPLKRRWLGTDDPNYKALSLEDQMWLTMKGMAERRQDPFHFSNLPDLLELETWKPREALLILSGVDPGAAMLDWSYENFLGAEIHKPRIRRATWFADYGDHYDWPLMSDYGKSPREQRKEIEEARASGKDVREAEAWLRDMERWGNDDTTKFVTEMLSLRSSMLHHLSRRWFTADHDPEAKHSPEFFIRWAEARGFVIEWANWARERGFIEIEPISTSPPPFDADSEDYPELLHIAVRAWEHARQTEGGTPKRRIIEFVEKRYPGVSEGARDAIALIANWQKVGGRPKSG
jgi:hypothetical protein